MNDCLVRSKGKARCMQTFRHWVTPVCAPCCVSLSSCLLPASAFTVTGAKGEAKRLAAVLVERCFFCRERDMSVPWHSYEGNVLTCSTSYLMPLADDAGRAGLSSRWWIQGSTPVPLDMWPPWFVTPKAYLMFTSFKKVLFIFVLCVFVNACMYVYVLHSTHGGQKEVSVF